MNFNKIYGSPRFPEIPIRELNRLHESAIRSAIQYYTIQGYISENRVIEYLDRQPDIVDIRRVPDNADGHGGDVSFVYNGVTYTMEIKTLTLRDGKGSLHMCPTRKSDLYKAYRRTDFDLLAVNITGRARGGLLFARMVDLPVHKKDDRFIQATMMLHEAKKFVPFLPSIKKVL
jgi:hypothetical protein